MIAHLVATYPVISFSVGRAKPKSNIFNSQSSLTAILDGFKSCFEFVPTTKNMKRKRKDIRKINICVSMKQ